MPHIRINKGHDIQISGVPNNNITNIKAHDTLALLPSDFRGVKPKLLVKEGDNVKIGSPLFFNKLNPIVKWASPGSGKVNKIEYGPRRVIKKIELLLSDEQQHIEHKKFKNSDIIGLDRDKVITSILEANIFPIFRQRTFNIIPNTEIL